MKDGIRGNACGGYLNSVEMALLEYAATVGSLKFGSFKLHAESERISPYFFDSSLLTDGKGLSLIGRACAEALISSGMKCDVLFGPAYKGIPLASVTATALWRGFSVIKQVNYNRKEAKDHGEAGIVVGACIKGKRLVLVDDVITAGTAVRESIGFIEAHGDERTSIVGLLVLLDRQERGIGELSAVQEVQNTYGLQVASVLNFEKLRDFSFHMFAREQIEAMDKYREQYGI